MAALTVVGAASVASFVPWAGAGAAPDRGGNAGNSGWVVQPTPDVSGALPSELLAVSCPTASFCMAVGTAGNGTIGGGGTGTTLSASWDGTSWTVLPTPSPAGTDGTALTAVDCSAPDTCAAIGTYSFGQGPSLTLFETWDGHAWTIATDRGLAGATLDGIACPSATSCTAVGSSTSVRSGAALSARWNGVRWMTQPMPAPPASRSTSLTAVSCPSPTDCTAVGSYTAHGRSHPMAVHGKDGVWKLALVPMPGHATGGAYLDALSCPTRTSCMAVGGTSTEKDSLEGFTLAERWNGERWAEVPTPSHIAPAAGAFLGAVSCPSAAACQAVGYDFSARGRGLTFADGWNGSTWTRERTDNGGDDFIDTMNGVACPATASCFAVGTAGPAKSLLEHWDGSSWTRQASPRVVGPTDSLDGVACPSDGACEAVGSYLDGVGAAHPLALGWDGSAWTRQTLAGVGHTTSGVLTAVSCAGTAACLAVGTAYPSGTGLAEWWNGRRWRMLPAPGGGAPSAVSCASPTACTVVAGGSSGLAGLQWNGASWTEEPLPTPPGAIVTFVFGVSCSAATACTAVGESDTATTGVALVDRWDGRTWRGEQPTAAPGGANDAFVGVSCPTATSCTAVGGAVPPDSPYDTPLAESWNGTTWSLEATPDPRPDFSVFLSSVSCSATTACTAVGTASGFGGPGGLLSVPLVEAWDGTRWATERTPPERAGTGAGFNSVSCSSASACTAVGESGTDLGTGTNLAERHQS